MSERSGGDEISGNRELPNDGIDFDVASPEVRAEAYFLSILGESRNATSKSYETEREAVAACAELMSLLHDNELRVSVASELLAISGSSIVAPRVSLEQVDYNTIMAKSDPSTLAPRAIEASNPAYGFFEGAKVIIRPGVASDGTACYNVIVRLIFKERLLRQEGAARFEEVPLMVVGAQPLIYLVYDDSAFIEVPKLTAYHERREAFKSLEAICGVESELYKELRLFETQICSPEAMRLTSKECGLYLAQLARLSDVLIDRSSKYDLDQFEEFEMMNSLITQFGNTLYSIINSYGCITVSGRGGHKNAENNDFTKIAVTGQPTGISLRFNTESSAHELVLNLKVDVNPGEVHEYCMSLSVIEACQL